MSLVLEGNMAGNRAEGEPSSEKIRPTAVYLIDNSGVRKLAVHSRRRNVAVLALIIGACLQYALQKLARRSVRRINPPGTARVSVNQWSGHSDLAR